MPRRRIDPSLAVAYVRVSTDEQHLGPEAQRAAIEAWGARKEVRLHSWHEDLDVSGAKGVKRRPGLAAALAAVKASGARYLAVAKRDRLARDVEIASFVAAQVRALGAVIVTADGLGEQQTIGEQLMTTMVDAFGQYERGMIRERTRAGLAVKRRRGERVGLHAAYGYRLEGVDAEGKGGRLVPDENEQSALAEILRRSAAGESVRKIAAALDVGGWPPRGRRWHPTTIVRLLRRLENPDGK